MHLRCNGSVSRSGVYPKTNLTNNLAVREYSWEIGMGFEPMEVKDSWDLGFSFSEQKMTMTMIYEGKTVSHCITIKAYWHKLSHCNSYVCRALYQYKCNKTAPTLTMLSPGSETGWFSSLVSLTFVHFPKHLGSSFRLWISVLHRQLTQDYREVPFG